MLALENLKVTAHARKAVAERNVDLADLADVLAHPAQVEPHDGKRRFVGRGVDLVAVVAGPDDAPVLITVLLREESTWTNEDARRRFR